MDRKRRSSSAGVEGKSRKMVKHESKRFPQKSSSEEIGDKRLLVLEEQWIQISRMRESANAPVDTMGAESVYDHDAPKNVRDFQILVGLLLSAQTKDPVTAAAMKQLRDFGLSSEHIASEDVSVAVINELIKKVGFHNKKAENLKKLAVEIMEKYDGQTPCDYETLLKFKGVGPKMALLFLKIACGRVEGISVDTHVHRISNRLGWVSDTKDPKGTRRELESWLPREKWADVNKLLVGLGQQICVPIGPKCSSCLLAKEKLCPSSLC